MSALDTAAVADPPARAPAPPAFRDRPAPDPRPPARPARRPPATHAPQEEARHAVVIPASALASYDGFRAWTRSEDYPDFGRIELIGGDLFVDLTMEKADAHGSPKMEIARVFATWAKRTGGGKVYCDSTRYALTGASASFEPDVSFLSYAAVEEGRVTRVPSADGDMIEFAGPPDVVVEVLSDSSETKDEIRLPVECFAGGVAEYWLADCRGEEITFSIRTRGSDAFVPAAPDADGFAVSPTFGRRYRLTRERDPLGGWDYELQER